MKNEKSTERRVCWRWHKMYKCQKINRTKLMNTSDPLMCEWICVNFVLDFYDTNESSETNDSNIKHDKSESD